MKFIISSADFKRALRICSEVAPVTSTVSEEQTGVQITTGDKKVRFFAVNALFSELVVEVPADVLEAGDILVRCAKLYTSVNTTFKEEGTSDDPNLLTVELSGENKLRVQGVSHVSDKGRRISSFCVLPLLDLSFFYEPLKPFDRTRAVQIPSSVFVEGLSKLAQSVLSNPQLKPKYAIVSVSFEDNEIQMLATDGLRIGRYRKPALLVGDSADSISFIINSSLASVANRLLPVDNTPLQFYVEDDRLVLLTQLDGLTVQLSTALSNAEFPDCSSYLQTENRLLAIFPNAVFLSLLQSAITLMDKTSHRVIISADKQGAATITASSADGHSENSDMEVQTPEDFEIHFDVSLLISGIRLFRGEKFNFYFNPKTANVIMQDSVDDTFTFLVSVLKKM